MKAKGSYAAVSVEYVAEQIATNKMILVDSRPLKPKYNKGHIPTAISAAANSATEIANNLVFIASPPFRKIDASVFQTIS